MLGRNTVVVKRHGGDLLLPISKIRSILNLKDETFYTDEKIQYFMHVAIEWVQDRLSKTLLPETRESVSYNNRFVLPYGPVASPESIEKVTHGKKELKKGEYEIRICGDSLEIQVPFSWKTRALTVRYKAGYTNAEAVPEPLKNAVMRTIEYLVNNGGDITVLEAETAPWLRAYKTYRI
jgi:hypothetical protein